MSSLILNRVGIVLNFVAGFMIAPELIGTQRLKKAEEIIERVLHSSLRLLKLSLETMLVPALILIPIIGIVLYLCVILGWTIDQYFLGIFTGEKVTFMTVLKDTITLYTDLVKDIYDKPLIFILGTPLFSSFMVWIGKILNSRENPSSRIDKPFPYIVGLTLYIYTILFFPFIVAIITIISFLFYLMLRALYFITRKLSGDDKLRSLIIWWGVVFYVLGNLLQFLGTFEFVVP